MDTKICQSCGMPLTKQSLFGTNENQTPNEDYCIYCYKNGAFTQQMNTDEMIKHCAQFVEEFNKDTGHQLTKEEAVAQMKAYFPTLKRWSKEN